MPVPVTEGNHENNMKDIDKVIPYDGDDEVSSSTSSNGEEEEEIAERSNGKDKVYKIDEVKNCSPMVKSRKITRHSPHQQQQLPKQYHHQTRRQSIEMVLSVMQQMERVQQHAS